MTKPDKPRLRFFEEASGQRHIVGDDRFLYARREPAFRLNVIGTGTIGQEHMRVASLAGRAIVHGIYDRAAHSMDVAAEEYARHADNTLRRYRDLEEACSDPDADAIMVCTPNFTHCDVIAVAAQSGKPIFLEKPMATTLADAKRIMDLAADYPSFIQVGLQYRYKAPYVEALEETFARRSIGDVKTIGMSEYRPPFLDKVGQWNKFSEFSGGTLVEKCCHYFDLINLFAASEPARVYATGGQAVNFRDFERAGKRSDIDDHALVVIDYDNGIKASFTLNMFCPHFYEELVLCGDRGRLVASETFDFLRDDVALSSIAVESGEHAASRTTDVGYAKAIEQSGHHGSTYFEHLAFIDQLEGTKTRAATPIEGLWSIVVATAAQESIKTGQAVDVREFVERHELADVLGRSA